MDRSVSQSCRGWADPVRSCFGLPIRSTYLLRTLIAVMVEAERAACAWVERRAAALAAEVPSVIMADGSVC